MANYRIVCTTQAPAGAPPSHQHIVMVGTGSEPNHWTNKWTVDQVVAAMDRGDQFYTKGETSGKIALVEKFWCSHCRRYHIRSHKDAVRDNNLDNLRRCQW